MDSSALTVNCDKFAAIISSQFEESGACSHIKNALLTSAVLPKINFLRV